MNQKKIGEFISSVRRERKLTQAQLAEKLNLSVNAVSKWERGINLPDYSNLPLLCEILNISLNELFAGEHLSSESIEKTAEQNILDLLKQAFARKRKNQLILGLLLILTAVFFIIAAKTTLINLGVLKDDNLKCTQIYLPDDGDVDIIKFGEMNLDFDIGANKYGKAVFKNPDKALKRLKTDYAEGIALIKKEYHLLPLNDFTYKSYKTYGWQTATGDSEQKAQARFVTQFLDIYENSFR